MGMAPNEFLAEAFNDVSNGKGASLARHLGVKDDLQQQIAEFLAKIIVRSGVDGFEDLVGFLDHILLEGSVGLLRVPRASARGTQAVHQRYETGEGLPGSFETGFVVSHRFARSLLATATVELATVREQPCRFSG